MLPSIHPLEMPRALEHLLTQASEQTPTDPSFKSSRRNFLKLAGLGGLALGAFPYLHAAEATPALKATQLPAAFVQIAPDGIVTVTINRLEFGQGVHTALPMILAEELDADWSMVRSQHGNSDAAYHDPLFGLHITGGSNSIKNSFTQYRELGARARLMLLSAAAQQWKTDISSLHTDRGFVHAKDGRRLAYGELAEVAMRLPVPETVTLKNPNDFRIIGHATNRLDAAAKSSGQQRYGMDVHLPEQLTAVVARPPIFGAKLAALDDSAARAVKGVKAIIRIPLDRGAEGVAVIADGYWNAKLGRDALKLTWDDSKLEKLDSAQQLARYKKLAAQPGAHHFDADMSALKKAPKQLSAEFVFPYLAHAAMEPLNCTVAWKDHQADVYTGSQCPGLDAAAVARTLGLKPEQVTMHVQMAGGGFGRRFASSSDFVVEACEIVKGARALGLHAPIRSIWSREDDMHGGYYRPMHFHKAQIGFDEKGNVLAWDHVIVGQSITAGSVFEQLMVKNGVDATAVEGMREPYPFPMRLTVHHPQINVPVLWWRSVGSTHTAFVMETLVDDIARATKQDPVAYRMKLFGDQHPRHRAALQLAVEQSGYDKKRLPAKHAWGVAVHESFSTVVAYVVEATIHQGQPVLKRVTAGVHCNLAVNPRTIETQVQGAAIMGLGMCLPGAAITLKNGVVEQSNFNDFTVARITDIPAFTVHIVPSAEPPTGMGEPGLPPLAPAFANAIARLTGKSMRQLPFKLA